MITMKRRQIEKLHFPGCRKFRRNHRSIGTAFEHLEVRAMMAVFASLERLDSGDEVLVSGSIEAYVAGATNTPWSVPLTSDPSDQTHVELTSPTLPPHSVEYEDAAAGGILTIAADHNTAIGNTSPLAMATVTSGHSGFALGGESLDAWSMIEGTGRSSGKYTVDLNDIPSEDAKYYGYLAISSVGEPMESATGIAEIDVAPAHYAGLTTIGEYGAQHWYIQSVALRPDFWDDVGGYDFGDYHAGWLITEFLPGMAEPQSYTKFGGFGLRREISWDYDSTDEATTVDASVDYMTGIGDYAAESVAYADELGEAAFNWRSKSQAYFYVAGSDGDHTVPPGIEDPYLDDAPPKVTNVRIGSSVANSYGTNPDYNFDGVDGSVEQLRTVPVGGANEISITFSKDVFIDDEDLELLALNRVESMPPLGSFEAPSDGNGFTAKWTYEWELPWSQYLLRISDAVEDTQGQYLDGEWTNPTSVLSNQSSSIFPSGNNISGGDFEFVFTLLLDTNRDMMYSAYDENVIQNNLWQSDMTWEDGDISGDGWVALADTSGMNQYVDWRLLSILGDYDGDFDVDDDDFDEFTTYMNSLDPVEKAKADLNGDGLSDSGDLSVFSARYGIDLPNAS